MVLKAGVIGAGDAGRRNARAVAAVEGIELAWVCDIDPAKVDRFLADFAGAVAVDHANLKTVACDLWCVCTPPAAHLSSAQHLLAGEARILIEKPPAATLADAQKFAESTLFDDARVSVVAQHRFAPASQMMYRICADQPYGAPQHVSINIYRQRSAAQLGGSWKSDAAASGGGVVMSLGFHTLDLVRWWLGPIKHLAAHVAFANGGDTETGLAAIGRQGSALFTASMAIGANRTRADRVEVEFERGRVVWEGDGLWIDDIEVEPAPPRDSLHARQIMSLLHAGGEADSRVSFGDSLDTLALIDDLYAASGRVLAR